VLLAGVLGMAGFLTFVPLYALDLGMGGSRVVLLLFAAVVVGIRGVGARIPDRLGPARATRIALALSAAGLAMVGAWRTPAGLVAGTAVFATGVALLTPAVMTLAVQGVAPRERGGDRHDLVVPRPGHRPRPGRPGPGRRGRRPPGDVPGLGRRGRGRPAYGGAATRLEMRSRPGLE
jgi:hypothetical protein